MTGCGAEAGAGGEGGAAPSDSLVKTGAGSRTVERRRGVSDAAGSGAPDGGVALETVAARSGSLAAGSALIGSAALGGDASAPSPASVRPSRSATASRKSGSVELGCSGSSAPYSGCWDDDG
jgi:hypothetical protein